jgi:hypothetical protein
MRARPLGLLALTLLALGALGGGDAEARVRGLRRSSPTGPGRHLDADAPGRHREPDGIRRDARDDDGRRRGVTVGGVLAGGILGRLLRGRSEGEPVVGLPDVLFLAGGALLLFRLLRLRAEALGLAGAGTLERSVHLVPLPRAAPGRAAPADPGRLALTRTDIRAELEAAGFAAEAGRCAAAVQQALALGDPLPVYDRLAPAAYAALQARCRAGSARARAERIGAPRVELLEAWRDRDYEQVLCRVRLHPGPDPGDERWTFRRPVGAPRWKLAAVEPATAG